VPDSFVVSHRQTVVSLAARNNIPAVYQISVFVRDGGLLSYGSDDVDAYRRAATVVDRILRGEKPRDLPVQLPTKFDMAINLKTAKALGLTIPKRFWRPPTSNSVPRNIGSGSTARMRQAPGRRRQGCAAPWEQELKALLRAAIERDEPQLCNCNDSKRYDRFPRSLLLRCIKSVVAQVFGRRHPRC
jgi:hypothetical protein